MAFANLFTTLSAVEHDVTSPGQRRNEPEDGERRPVRQRKTQGEQTGAYKKKRCYKAQTTRPSNATGDDSNATHYHMHNTNSEHASVGFTTEVIHNYSDKSGQNYKAKNNPNVKKKKQHQQKDRGGPVYRGGHHQTRPTWRKGGDNRRSTNDKQVLQVKRMRFMTQEFKDQNVLLVDGRLLCRHFLWGRCIKGDDCQLEHVQGHNDLVKELCKFYVQGFCTKGTSCPYMHKSFPCKFFHRKGKCSQGADCRFSHEPLNDVTSKLLDEALKRENDLSELAKKADQDSSGQPANTDESEIMETNETPNIFLQPLRPNFYQSTDTDAEKVALFSPTEEPADIVEEAVPPHASDAAQPHSPSSGNLTHEEPVCYSVEAVLGPQLSKPFISFFTTPRSKEFTPLSSSDCTSASANQSQVPYSVDAVLRSCKSVENSTSGHTPTPPAAQTVSYSPKTYFEEATDPLLSSETQNKEVLNSVNSRNEVNKSQEKGLSSLQVHAGPNLSLTSGDHKKQGRNIPESLKPVRKASHEVKVGLSADIKCSVNHKTEDVLPFGPTKHKSIFSWPTSQTSISEHPPQLKPHLSLLTPDSQASCKPFCTSSGFTEFKGGAAVLAEPVTTPIKSSDSANSVNHSASKQPTELTKETQSGLKLGTKHNSTETTADCSSKMEYCGDWVDGCKKTLKRPFHSLFASPITLQTIDTSVTSSSGPQGSIQSPCPAAQSTDCRRNHLKTTLEPDKASAKSFLSLFAAPLTAAPFSSTSSCSHQSVQSADTASHLSDSKQRASNLDTPLSHQVRTEEVFHALRSPNSCANPKIRNDCSPELLNQPTEQLVNPTSPAACGDSSSTSTAHKQLPDISSHKGSAAAATENSVLKTLFVYLSPYQQDGEQQNSAQILSESGEKGKNSMGCVLVKQLRKSRKRGRRKRKFENQDLHKEATEKTLTHSREHQPPLQTPQISLEATGGSTLSSSRMTKHQVRDSSTHNLPFKPVVPLTLQPRLKLRSEEGKSVNGNVAATPLKDLFKTLDTAVFHLGH